MYGLSTATPTGYGYGTVYGTVRPLSESERLPLHTVRRACYSLHGAGARWRRAAQVCLAGVYACAAYRKRLGALAVALGAWCLDAPFVARSLHVGTGLGCGPHSRGGFFAQRRPAGDNVAYQRHINSYSIVAHRHQRTLRHRPHTAAHTVHRHRQSALRRTRGRGAAQPSAVAARTSAAGGNLGAPRRTHPHLPPATSTRGRPSCSLPC